MPFSTNRLAVSEVPLQLARAHQDQSRLLLYVHLASTHARLLFHCGTGGQAGAVASSSAEIDLLPIYIHLRCRLDRTSARERQDQLKA